MGDTRWNILGPLSVTTGQGLIEFPAPKQRVVLALLIAAANTTVSVHALVEEIWQDIPPQSAVANVRTYVADVRRLLGSCRDRVQTSAGGYRLLADEGSIDAVRFAAAVQAGAGEARAGDWTGAANAHRDGLRLWRGEALDEVPVGPRLARHLQLLRALRCTATEGYAEAAVELGREHEAVAVLRPHLADNPLRETGWYLLVRALHRGGDSAAALSAFEQCRAVLDEELGVGPGPDLQRLHREIVTGRPLAEPAPAAAGQSPVTGAAARWLGPRLRLATVIGRTLERADLAGCLRVNRLVTVVGPAGCGKTTLGLCVAQDWPGAVTVLMLDDLAAGADPSLALAGLLGVQGRTMDAAQHNAARALRRPPRQLLVLDNAEHLVAGAGGLVTALLAACPDLTVLVTSRRPLGVSEETVWALRGLPVPAGDESSPATELFTQRAREALACVDLSDTGSVAAIVRGLDGLPLAVELAAARVRAFPVPQLAVRLAAGLQMLSVAGANSPGGSPRGERHRTLRAAIDWSYRLLDSPERAALADLSVFRGAFTLDAAAAVGKLTERAEVVLAGLVDSSLAVADTSGPVARFQLLETIRQYAQGRLDDSGARDAAAGRHLRYWLARAAELSGTAAFADRVALARQLLPDLPDAEAALRGAQALGAWADFTRLAVGLQDCWNVNPGYPERGVRWLALAEQGAPDCPPELLADARIYRGQLLASLGRQSEAAKVLRLAAADELALPPQRRTDLLCVLLQNEINLLDPLALGRRAALLAAAHGLPDADLRALSLDTVIAVSLEWDDLDLAAALLVEHGVLADTDCRWLIPRHHSQQALLAAKRGDFGRARAALALANEDGQPTRTGPPAYSLLRVSAAVLLAADEPAVAAEYLRSEVGQLRGRPDAANWVSLLGVPHAEALRRTGAHVQACRVLVDGLAAAMASGHLRMGLPGILVAAALAHDLGDAPVAAELAGAWRTLRAARRLPVPTGYQAAAARLPDAAGPRAASPQETLTAALYWCRTRLA